RARRGRDGSPRPRFACWNDIPHSELAIGIMPALYPAGGGRLAKDGYLIFDSDTHVGPSMDVLERYLSAAERALLEPFADKRRVNKRTGQVTYVMGERKYERRMGEAESQPV